MFLNITHLTPPGNQASARPCAVRRDPTADRTTDSTRDVRIIVADDHPLILLAVTEALATAPPLKIVAAVKSGKQLLAALETQRCDLVVTDFSMQQTPTDDDGLSLIRGLRSLYPELPVIVFTMLTNGAILQQIKQLGVAGIACKDESVSALVEVCTSPLLGKQTVLSPGIAQRIERESIAGACHGMQPLSAEELEVARLYGLGNSVREIARRLNLSVAAVVAQKRAAMRKLRIGTSAELIRFVKNGMVSLPRRTATV